MKFPNYLLVSDMVVPTYRGRRYERLSSSEQAKHCLRDGPFLKHPHGQTASSKGMILLVRVEPRTAYKSAGDANSKLFRQYQPTALLSFFSPSSHEGAVTARISPRTVVTSIFFLAPVHCSSNPYQSKFMTQQRRDPNDTVYT